MQTRSGAGQPSPRSPTPRGRPRRRDESSHNAPRDHSVQTEGGSAVNGTHPNSPQSGSGSYVLRVGVDKYDGQVYPLQVRRGMPSMELAQLLHAVLLGRGAEAYIDLTRENLKHVVGVWWAPSGEPRPSDYQLVPLSLVTASPEVVCGSGGGTVFLSCPLLSYSRLQMMRRARARTLVVRAAWAAVALAAALSVPLGHALATLLALPVCWFLWDRRGAPYIFDTTGVQPTAGLAFDGLTGSASGRALFAALAALYGGTALRPTVTTAVSWVDQTASYLLRQAYRRWWWRMPPPDLLGDDVRDDALARACAAMTRDSAAFWIKQMSACKSMFHSREDAFVRHAEIGIVVAAAALAAAAAFRPHVSPWAWLGRTRLLLALAALGAVGAGVVATLRLLRIV